MVRTAVGLGLSALLCVSAAGRQGGVTLSQYDQVGAEVNGTLDVALLQQWLTETNANTMSFLLWDTDGHQYLDMVRFLQSSADFKVGGHPIKVWVSQ